MYKMVWTSQTVYNPDINVRILHGLVSQSLIIWKTDNLKSDLQKFGFQMVDFRSPLYLYFLFFKPCKVKFLYVSAQLGLERFNL